MTGRKRTLPAACPPTACPVAERGLPLALSALVGSPPKPEGKGRVPATLLGTWLGELDAPAGCLPPRGPGREGRAFLPQCPDPCVRSGALMAAGLR